jgi:hypothetical protein
VWEFHVISGLDGGRVAVLFKMHHALSDGLNVLRELPVGEPDSGKRLFMIRRY